MRLTDVIQLTRPVTASQLTETLFPRSPQSGNRELLLQSGQQHPSCLEKMMQFYTDNS